MIELEKIPHIHEISNHGPYHGAREKNTATFQARSTRQNKLVPSLEEAIRRTGLKDGMTISFHHHFRNGDHIINTVVDKLAEMGYKNLTLAASSLAAVHAPLIRHIQNGVITHIETSGMRGELAEQVSRGLIDCPVVFRSHGGRASAIRSGDLHIDVAFLGAPSCDPYGNANGYSRDDEDGIACGSLGYARTDATYADNVIVITNHLVAYPNAPWAIPEFEVDYVVMTDDIGDPKGIMSGATRYTKDPKELLIAKTAANVIEAAGYLYDGFSMQMGSGGASLATARFLRQKMIDQNIHCRFALGGITGQIAAMHEEGLIDRILDVQSFDLDAAKSLKNNHFHHQISASYYASHMVAAAVDQLATLAEQIGVPVYKPAPGSRDVVAVAREALEWARTQNGTVMIFDTAGRQEVDEALIDELRHLHAFLAPRETLLVADAATGQQAVNVAQTFDRAVNVTGIVLTKLDGDARGGAALSMRSVTGKPIKFSGEGEKLDQFGPFVPGRMADRILGMGDIVGLVEHAAARIDEEQAAKSMDRMMSGKFDFNDFLDQMKMMQSLGPLEGLLGLLPGFGKIKKQLPEGALDPKRMKHMEAIVLSMTAKERSNPNLLNPSRRRRIAAGCGRPLMEVNKLIKNFSEMRKMMSGKGKMGAMMKQMASMKGKGGKIPGFPGMGGGLGGLKGLGGLGGGLFGGRR